MDILVSGAGIAGPATAYWLQRAGHRVTVVERAAELRTGGQNVDVRGGARDVLRRMGLEDAALAARTGETGLRFVDHAGAAIAEFPAGTGDSDGPTAELEVLRGALSGLLVDAGGPGIDYRFGVQITVVSQDDSGVDVDFSDGTRRRFDILVIADGVRSATRRLVFGDVDVRALGLYTAYGTITRSATDDLWWSWYNAPGGRSITVRPDNVGTTRVALSFLSEGRGYENMDGGSLRAALRTRYRDAGWIAPRILDELDVTEELYVDYLGQVRMPRWSSGRVVALGDAAWCATPISGMGTSLALTGAYVLAGEVATRPTVGQALAGYEAVMRPMVERAQRLPPGTPRLAHPRSRLGVALLRNVIRVAGSAPARAIGRHLPSGGGEAEPLAEYRFDG
ncbi:FAD-dependent oxidoreductase [Mycolicibacterium sp. F2034L]|uniref:FAD-dependent oxidoreductase n=1 Tax=Mycolicibacterium sp. F2034L TaxID=2926422 RepID=UPI001FF3438C|nr:FAD-dependent oxidoreductase [Mycolicibacterium sp. F2034L]MCK0173668.1 FAD-dependent oxidoreductase [Mycolicibacterium sp. F2034L]